MIPVLLWQKQVMQGLGLVAYNHMQQEAKAIQTVMEGQAVQAIYIEADPPDEFEDTHEIRVSGLIFAQTET